MIEFEITIKNYRCFSDERPTQLMIKDGFTALIGVNNSGKSSLLRFFYEIRNYYPNLINNILSCLDSNIVFNQMPPMKDKEQVFYNANQRDLVFEIKSYEKDK